MSTWHDPSSWSVVVTGGSSGLGAATCARLVEAGARVVSLDRRPDEGGDGRDPIPTEVVDLADPDAAAVATERAVERLGGVDAVVCCAGIDVPGELLAVDPKEWRRVVEINLFGTASVARAALPSLLERQGRLVTVASTLAHKAVSDATAYCASKFGVVGFTRALTAELKGRVGVTMLTPGGMHTSFFDERDDQYKPPPDAILADPGDVADTLLWVLSRPAGIEVRELAVMAPVEGSWP
jgi:NAD(P)-dependent dehydrogenase (short-subunit alcohol dehydrogenase family)